MAETSRRLFVKKKYTIEAGQTLVVDTLKANSFQCLDYVISLSQESPKLIKSFKMFVGSDEEAYTEQVYATIGQGPKISIETNIQESVYNLVFTNTGPEPIGVRLLRTIV